MKPWFVTETMRRVEYVYLQSKWRGDGAGVVSGDARPRGDGYGMGTGTGRTSATGDDRDPRWKGRALAYDGGVLP